MSTASSVGVANPGESQRTLSLLTMLRLGLFQMGLGMMSVLTLGVLNRIMIKELAIPATIAAGVIAVHQFMAPARLWVGQLSDAKPIAGYHRTSYVWLGAALLAIAAFLAVQVMWHFGTSLQTRGWNPTTQAWMAFQGLIFALYGLALSTSSTPFAALLVDVSTEKERSKLVGVVWSMLMVGIVIGAILTSKLLPSAGATLSPAADLETLRVAVNRIFVIVPLGVVALAVVATWGVEKNYSYFLGRTHSTPSPDLALSAPSPEASQPFPGPTQAREDQIGFGAAWTVLTASRQTGIFFTFLLVMTISLFMQDAVLESFGGQVFGMSVSETTQLNAFYGMGTLIGIAVTGFVVVPRLGKQTTTRLGCLLVGASALLLGGSGFLAQGTIFRSGVFLFGLASGVTTTGAISLMLDLTAVETAGTFIGAWGLAQAIARGLSTVLGGTVLDIGGAVFQPGSPLAYGLVFLTQALGMIVAIALLSRVNVREFQKTAQDAIASVWQSELD